jgi:hypothetical protein
MGPDPVDRWLILAMIGVLALMVHVILIWAIVTGRIPWWVYLL